MKKLIFFRLLWSAGFLLCGGHSGAAEAFQHPNILLIVSDDQGYADVGFQGCKDIPTPHLDRMAREGAHCRNGYVTHPFCSPTRAALMTGRYQQRFGHENNPYYDPADHLEGLPTSETLLPDHLRKAGYATGWVGKWHLGAAPEFSPLKRGFGETFGFVGGGHRYQNWKPDVRGEYVVPILRNGQPVEVTNHLTMAFGAEAASFVRRHSAGPWFLYLAFNAPHNPQEPAPERLARFASIPDPMRRAYAAQVSLMDDAIGETLEALRSSGQEDRTLVFFFSDNGGPVGVNGSSNAPLRGGKGSVYEGGVHVPYVVRWPGVVPAGKPYDEPVSSVDVFATSLAVAGVPMPTNRVYDSVNLVPFLRGEKTGSPHDRLFWRTSKAQWATRQGASKLVRKSGVGDEFYDLGLDPGESKDLSAARADVAAKLAASVEGWDKTLEPPAFPGLGARQPAKAAPAGKKAKTD